LLGAAILALATAGAAQAAVITFEGNSGPALNQQTIQQAGYTITFVDPGETAPPGTVQIGRFINGSDPNACGTSICPTNNTTTYFDLFNTGFIDITPTVEGSTFTFGGLDASLIALPGVDYPAFPAAIQVIGFRADNSSETIQFNLPDVTAFQTFNVLDAVGGESFAQQNFVEIAIVGFSCNASGICTGLDNSAGEIGLDNIALSDLPTGNVPEPATASLLALGLLGLGARARRRA
jgi:hypothetical protein